MSPSPWCVFVAGTNQQRALLGGEQGLGLFHHLLEELLHHVGQRLDLGVEVVGQRLDLGVQVLSQGLDLILNVGDEGLDLLLQLGGLGLDPFDQRLDLGPAVLHVSPVGDRGRDRLLLITAADADLYCNKEKSTNIARRFISVSLKKSLFVVDYQLPEHQVNHAYMACIQACIYSK